MGALAVVEILHPTIISSPPEAVQWLLSEFADVFATPTSLPPSRFHDHHIPLVPNAALVNSRLY